jgi:hypothetical protein
MAEEVGVQIGRVCPGCGREDSVPRVMGLPSPGLWQLAERGLVSLGGCEVFPDGVPAFTCRACGLDWGRNGDPTSDEQALAELIGVEFTDLARVLGTGWGREDAAEGEPMEWFVSGEPAQLAVGVEGSLFVLARPLAGWGEPRREVYPEDGRRFGRDDLLWFPEVVTEAAEAIAARRRRSFRWCRTCRRVHAPEDFLGSAGTCHSCASTFAGDDV